MNYEQKYEEALKRAKHYHDRDNIHFLEHIFPELRESEDERIRKAIFKALSKKDARDVLLANGIQVSDALAWLEKQGEQKNIDESKPKFKVGDWITNGEYTWKVTDIKPLDYILQSQNGEVVDDTISYVDEEFHLWTIQDAKDGDVLFTTCDNINEMVFIYRGIEFDTTHCYFLYSKTNNECKTFNSVCSVKADIHPATKEQCDLLFQKMKEVGYEWDAEKKELKKIYQEYPLTPSECFKPAWSGEDEKIYSLIYSAIKNDTQIASPSNKKDAIDWLKSLKDRVQPKQEWSEEDEKMCQETIDWFEKKCFPYALENENPARESINWLKSLKPRWKPSEEQMEALKYFISFHEDHARSLTTKWEEFKNLESLYNDLKSL